MLDQIFLCFLAFSHESIIIPLIIIGYIWLDRKVFFHSICLLFTSILFNIALKASFRVPLPLALGKEGFAFPSGHMQFSLVFYGWLFKSSNNLAIKISIAVLLIGISLGLLYFDYHNYIDILGAIFFGLLLLFAYIWLLAHKPGLLSIAVLIFSTLQTHMYGCHIML